MATPIRSCRSPTRRCFRPSCSEPRNWRFLELRQKNASQLSLASGATIDFLLSAKRDAAADERFLAKALSRCCVAFSREKEVDRRPGRVHGAVQIDPLALDPNVGLVHAPTVICRFKSRGQTSLHFRGVTLDPSPHGDVIGAHAPLDQQFLHVTV